jgi:zinc transport system substrate-binding protein
MIMKKILLIATVALIVAACGKRTQQDERPVITVTIEPQRYFAEAIAGDRFRIETMVPKGSSPETYDPTPSQLIGLSKSKAYLRIGYIGFEQTWMEKLESNAPQMAVFDTSKGVKLIADNGHHHSEEEAAGEEESSTHHHHGGVEPHIWNSTRNAIIIARNTLNALVSLDKENEAYYTARYDSLCHDIIETDSLIVKMLPAGGSKKSFLIYHPALSYFARDYFLNQISIEEGGKSPSPAHLKELVELCQRENVKIIFVQPEFDKRNAEVIAQETGVRIIAINPLNYNWKEEMLNVADALKENR